MMKRIQEEGRGKICTVPDCEDMRSLRWSGVFYCHDCGNARCEEHRDVPTGLSCCAQPPAAPPPDPAPAAGREGEG